MQAYTDEINKVEGNPAPVNPMTQMLVSIITPLIDNFLNSGTQGKAATPCTDCADKKKKKSKIQSVEFAVKVNWA